MRCTYLYNFALTHLIPGKVSAADRKRKKGVLNQHGKAVPRREPVIKNVGEDKQQCQATTLDGHPCSRDAIEDAEYCWQHIESDETRASNNTEAKQRTAASVVFGGGLVSLFLSLFWFLQGGGLGAILVALASIISLLAALVKDDIAYKGDSSKAALQRFTNAKLIDIIRGLGIVADHTGKNKSHLIEIVQQKRRALYRRGSLPKYSGLVLAVLAPFLVDAVFPPDREISPKLDLKWYRETDAGYKLVDPDTIGLFIGSEDILRRQIRLPIRIAVRNEGNKPLRVVRVELRYPREFPITSVRSSGRPTIDAEGRWEIYEHDIAILDTTQNYTLLTAVDTVLIPIGLIVSMIDIASNKVPTYRLLASTPTFVRDGKKVSIYFLTGFTLDVRVKAGDRPFITEEMQFIMFGGGTITDVWLGDSTGVTEDDVKLFTSSLRGARVLSHWNHNAEQLGNENVDYLKVEARPGTVQLISVDDTLRKMIVDSDADGDVDFTLVNSDSDPQPDFKFVFNQSWPMFDWEVAALTSAPPLDIHWVDR